MNSDDIRNLPVDEQAGALENLDERALSGLLQNLLALNKHRAENQLEEYVPYPKQKLFHDMGTTKIERLLTAGNRLGKTYAGSAEAAYHATGLYPDWWQGRRWDRPTRGWVGGESSTVVRDTSQKLLLGDLSAGMDNLGTGMIPADKIIDVTFARGVAMGVDTVTIRHTSGGKSVIKFKSYEQQRIKWQGDSVDWVWFDEEPPMEIYTEGIARYSETDGMSWMTFTPLKGMSTVVKRFKNEANEYRDEVIMTVYDAGHMDEDKIKKMLSKYPEHEHDCRINGVPMQGEGRIYQYAESVIRCDPFTIPDYWAHLIGLDLGHGEHPTAAVWLAYDRDTDTIYLYREYRMKGGTISAHANALQSMGRIPVAWPQDTEQGDKGVEGITVKKHYENNHAFMLSSHARFPDDRGNSVWAGIVDLQQRIEQGRFKVFSTCSLWFEEYRNYHMEDGKIVKKDDDLLDATRYGDMMILQAKTIDRGWRPGQRRPGAVTVAPGTDFNVFG